MFLVDLSSHGVGSLLKSSWVVTPITVGNFFMQISTAIIEKSFLFNTVESMHDNVTKIMSMLIFSW